MILTSRLFPASLRLPTLSYGTDDPPKADNPNVQLGVDDTAPLAGDEEPNWDFIENPDLLTQKPPEEAPDDEKEAETPEPKETKPEATPEPGKEAKKEEATKEGETKPLEAKEETPKKLPTEAEVDAMEARAGASTKFKHDFKEMKENVVKPALRRITELETELSELKKKPLIDEETQKRLDQAARDREIAQAFELENDPLLKEEFKAREEKAREELYETLLQGGLVPESIERLKGMKLENEDDKRAWDEARLKIIDHLKEDPLAVEEVLDAYRAVALVEKEKRKTLKDLRNKQGDYFKELGERETKERNEWAEKAKQHILKLMPSDDRLALKTAKADATPQEKAEIEAHNKRINEVLAPKVQAGISNAWLREPEATIELVFKAVRHDEIETAYKALEEKSKKDLETANARIAELEADAGGIRRVSRPGHLGDLPPLSKPAINPPDNIDAHTAIDNFLAEQGIKE